MKRIISTFLGALACATVHAQPVSNEVVHGFGGPDGSYPCSLVLSSNRLYGAAEFGVNSINPQSGVGAIFAVNTDGSAFTNLVLFNGTNGQYPTSVILSTNTLYGVTVLGGSNGVGTIFSVTAGGSNFATLHTFDGISNGSPQGNLLLVSNVFYGTTFNPNSGTVYKMNVNGSGFSNIYTFSGSGVSDGQNPAAGVIMSGNVLYGTTENGGSNGNGTIFRVNIEGSGFTNLHSFTALDPNSQTNVDGANPIAVLLLAGNRLYGTANSGGAYQIGTIFSISTSGTGFTNLHDFTGSSDGASPAGGLVFSSNVLYGTAEFGGSQSGLVYGINTNGSGFTNIYRFSSSSGNMDGSHPVGEVILSNNILYGTASAGGETGDGDQGLVFGLILGPSLIPPQPVLSIALSGGKYVVSWPRTNAGFNLQTRTSVASGSWATVSNGVTSNGVGYFYSNVPSGSAAFFRLER